MKIICSLILSITSLLFARAAVFQGTVLDQNSKKPIQALIYARENYNWHTRSQGSGYFKLLFPDTVTDSIIIFSPGYETVVTAWESDDSSHTYYLERLPHLSDDDLRSLEEVNLKMLAEEAIASLWTNIPDKPHELGAFCRVTSSKEGQVRYPYHRKFWTEYQPVRTYPLPKGATAAFGGLPQLEMQFERNAKERGIRAE